MFLHSNAIHLNVQAQFLCSLLYFSVQQNIPLDKEAYSELTQTFKMEVLRNIANDVKRLTLDVWPAFKYVSEVCSPHVVFIKIDS